MIISLSGLQGIPQELQEAARVDGANAWQVFRRITLPLLSPIILFGGHHRSHLRRTGNHSGATLSVKSASTTVTSVPESNYLYMIQCTRSISHKGDSGTLRPCCGCCLR